MKLVIEAQTSEELHAHLLRFCEVFGLKKQHHSNPMTVTESFRPSSMPPGEVTPVSSDGVEEVEDLKPTSMPLIQENPVLKEEAPPEKKQKRAKKETSAITGPAQLQTSIPASTETPLPNPSVAVTKPIDPPQSFSPQSVPDPIHDIVPTRQEVLEALQYICKEKSLDAGKRVLSKYGVQRVSELHENNYAAFVHDCRKQTND